MSGTRAVEVSPPSNALSRRRSGDIARSGEGTTASESAAVERPRSSSSTWSKIGVSPDAPSRAPDGATRPDAVSAPSVEDVGVPLGGGDVSRGSIIEVFA